jgi:Ca2+-transporting ATPase
MLFEKLFIKVHLLQNPQILPTIRPGSELDSVIMLVRDNLGDMFPIVGAIYGLHRSSSRTGLLIRDEADRPTLRVYNLFCAFPSLTKTVFSRPSLMTMIVCILDWAPQAGSLSDPAHADPSKVCYVDLFMN